MRRFLYILAGAILISTALTAQERKLVRDGNKLYEEKKYKEAANAYQQALGKNPTYTPGLFNLGNSQIQQKQYDAARKTLGNTAKIEKDKNGKGAANYNIGNTYMQEQKWQEAVDAYKQALRNNPQDADAKYNLSYALSMLKKQQGGGGGNDKNKDKKDEKKDQQNKQDDKKDQDKKDQNKDQQDQQNNKDEKNKQEEQRPQPKPSKLSEEQAEQLLNALQQEEKKLQDKMQKEKGMPVKVDKDW